MGSGALRSRLVVSVEQAVAGPLCTRYLAELGAEVIKIEAPEHGDLARHYDQAIAGESAHFVWLNRGKKSVCLDLKSAFGKDAFRRLCLRADVLVVNLAPATAARLIDDEALAAANPNLVRCYISGYGTAGPWANRKAFDSLIQGEAGIIASTGTKEERAKSGVSVADLATALYAALLVTAQVGRNDEPGRGIRLDVSLFGSAVEWMMPLLLMQEATGTVPEPAGLHHSTIAPYGVYESLDGVQVNIAVQNNAQWRALSVDVLGLREVFDDHRFETNEKRVANRAALADKLVPAFRGRSSAELTAALDGAGVPWGRVNDLAEVVNHPQLEFASHREEVQLPGGATTTLLSGPVATALGRDGLDRAGPSAVPALGEHTVEVLGRLGYSAEEISERRSP